MDIYAVLLDAVFDILAMVGGIAAVLLVGYAFVWAVGVAHAALTKWK